VSGKYAWAEEPAEYVRILQKLNAGTQTVQERKFELSKKYRTLNNLVCWLRVKEA
jgi:hypothetical protein